MRSSRLFQAVRVSSSFKKNYSTHAQKQARESLARGVGFKPGGDFPDTQRFFERALGIQPQEVRVEKDLCKFFQKGAGRNERGDDRNERGDDRNERGDDRNERGDDRNERGDDRNERGDDRKDFRVSSTPIGETPSTEGAVKFFELGKMYREEEDIVGASGCYQNAITCDPNHLPSIKAMFQLCLEDGNVNGYTYYSKRVSEVESCNSESSLPKLEA